MFGSGNYKIIWLDKEDNVVCEKVMFLNFREYRKEIMRMQDAFLRGEKVEKMKCIPL